MTAAHDLQHSLGVGPDCLNRPRMDRHAWKADSAADHQQRRRSHSLISALAHRS